MSSASDPSILLLSGAGLPPWIWDDVRRGLDDHALETRVAPRPAGSDAGVLDHAEAAIESVQTDRFVVVAHSAGGVIGARIATLAPERVVAFLGIAAIVPPPGGSFLSALPVPSRWILDAVMRTAGTRPPDPAIRGSLARGLEERIVERLLADFTPESIAFYRDRVPDPAPTGPRGYVTTTRDRELPPAAQRRSARRLGADWHERMATGHLPMLEEPAALAEVVARFVPASARGRLDGCS